MLTSCPTSDLDLLLSVSLVFQVTVSGRGQFWDVCASFPGGTDPADILQNSSLWATAAEGRLSPAPPPVFMGKPLRLSQSQQHDVCRNFKAF